MFAKTSSDFYKASGYTFKEINVKKFTRFGSKQKVQASNSLAKSIAAVQQQTINTNFVTKKKSISHFRKLSSHQRLQKKTIVNKEQKQIAHREKQISGQLQLKAKQLLKLAKHLHKILNQAKSEILNVMQTIKNQFSLKAFSQTFNNLSSKFFQLSSIVDDKNLTNKNIFQPCKAMKIARKSTISTIEQSDLQLPKQNQILPSQSTLLNNQIEFNKYISSHSKNASASKADQRTKSSIQREKEVLNSTLNKMKDIAPNDITPLLTKQCKFVRTYRKNHLINN